MSPALDEAYQVALQPLMENKIILGDCYEVLKSIESNSINLILTDPPYMISKDSGMDQLYKKVKKNEKNNIGNIKSEKEWIQYKDSY